MQHKWNCAPGLFRLSILFCTILLSGISTAARAQTQSPPPAASVVAALNRQIHVSPDLSVRQALKSIGDQIGVTIQLADYLGDRRLTAQLDHIPARDALDALGELEDWQWKEDGHGHILVERRPPLVPKEAGYLSRWMQSELPRDFRDYFGIPRPDDDPKKFDWPVLGNPASQLQRRLEDTFNPQINQQRLLTANHLPALQAGEKIRFDGLNAREQERLLLTLTMRAIQRTNVMFWIGDLPPFILDPSTASLEFIGNTLMVGTRVNIDDRTYEMWYRVTR